MAGAYDDRDGKIWMDGKLVEWRDAKVHILTHALHSASAVFEGERCYDGKIFKGHEHSLRLIRSAELLDMELPYTAEEIDAAKAAMLKANGWTAPARTWASPPAATRSASRSPAGNGATTTVTRR